MEITFDISKDEIPIFLAEVDEHLQVLDNSLLRLERGEPDSELVQTVFRSAHTIKGMSGMIGHRRMTDLTHALETALDGVRKETILISSRLINLCFETVDCLRLLRDEVATSQLSNVDIDEIVQSLKDITEEGNKDDLLTSSGQNIEPQVISTGIAVAISNSAGKTLNIHAKIDSNGMASAARAFQLMLALQDMGEIQSMTPTQAVIEIAASVSDFAATLVTDQPLEKISVALTQISGIDEISIDGRVILPNGKDILQPTKTVPEHFEQPGTAESNLSFSAKGFDPAADQPMRAKRSSDSAGRRITDMTLRMNVERLDNLMNLVGELITNRNHLQQIRGHLAAETRVNGNFEQLFETFTHLGQITDQIQVEVMHMRMLPIGSIFSRFPRMVHDMSQKVGKLTDVVIHGEETEVDRSMIEEIYDPLIHLIRNSVDHGIESPQERLAAGKAERGTIILNARYEEGRIILTIEDDGKGIDGEKLRNSAIQKGLISAEEAASLTEEQSVDLMFMAGLSTVEKVTELSGRGVGLDIVKTNIQRVNGTIQVETKRGHGTQFQIILPLTLAIVPSLLVKVYKSTFAIPLLTITETLRLDNSEIKYICQKPVTLLRGNVLPLIHLAEIFNLAQSEEHRKHLFAVVIHLGKQRVGLIVDSLIGEEEVVVKPLGTLIGEISGISSSTILGDGRVALIVDVVSLFKLIGN